MKRRARLLLGGSLVLLLLAAVVAVAIIVLEPFKQRVRLPGGQVVTLEHSDYGTVHTLVDDRWWEAFLPALKPRVLAFGPRVSHTARKALGWSVSFHANPRTPASPPWMGLADEHGCPFGAISTEGVLRVDPTAMIASAAAEVFPRRSRGIRLLLYPHAGIAGRADGQLILPNPLPGSYPVWTPERYPITKRAGTLAVTLSGIARESRWGYLRAAARLRMMDMAHPGLHWHAVQIRVSDATGNSLLRSSRSRWDSPYAFDGLCFHEAAWRLDVAVAPRDAQSVAPDSIWALRNVPVPASSAASRMTLRNPDRTLALVETARAGAPGWRNLANDPQAVYLRVRQSALPGCTTVALIRATDDRGWSVLRPPTRSIVPGQTGTSHLFTRETRDQDYRVRTEPSARSLNLTFAAYKPRTVTFLAKPGEGVRDF